MTRVLVTGASGLLGANLVLALRDRFEACAVFRRHGLRVDGMLCLPLDLTRRDQAMSVLPWQPDWIVHCAANTDVDYCELHRDEAWSANVDATRNVAEAAGSARARLIYLSTDSIFDGFKGNYRETDLPNPLNQYARTKLAGEQVARDLVPEALIIRTNIYGWNLQEKQSLAEWVVGALERGESIGGFSDVFFTPILVNDLADMIVEMIQRGPAGTYHVTGSQRISKLAFACTVAEVFELDRSLIHARSIREAHLAAPRPLDPSLRTARVCRDLGRDMPDVLQGLRRLRRLRDAGYVSELRAFRTNAPDVNRRVYSNA